MGIFDRVKRILRANLNSDVRRFDEILKDSDEELRRLIEELSKPNKDSQANSQKSSQQNRENSRQAPPSARHRAQVQAVYSAYKVLGLDPTASVDQIKAAYRSHMRQYHPDRVANASPAVQEAAKKKAQEINLAYDVLTKVRGFG